LSGPRRLLPQLLNPIGQHPPKIQLQIDGRTHHPMSQYDGVNGVGEFGRKIL
jgi:hypothetical protein